MDCMKNCHLPNTWSWMVSLDGMNSLHIHFSFLKVLHKIVCINPSSIFLSSICFICACQATVREEAGLSFPFEHVTFTQYTASYNKHMRWTGTQTVSSGVECGSKALCTFTIKEMKNTTPLWFQMSILIFSKSSLNNFTSHRAEHAPANLSSLT